MSKIVVVGDLHIGARNASLVVAKHQLKFFEEVLFPYMKKHDIKTILQLGDIFDTRKFTNNVVLYEWKKRFFNYVKEQGYNLHIILGNHDLATKNTVEINTPEILLNEYTNITIYKYPKVVKFGELNCLLVPWICLENHLEAETQLNDADALWCFGHFEIEGFEVHRGQINESGLSVKTFSKFEQVVSGHFHTKSERGNIKYTGTPYELTWIDYGDNKGFNTFDTVKRELTFVRNPLTLFNKVLYDDKDKGHDYFKSIDLTGLENTYVKVIVANKTDPYQFDKVMERLYEVQPLDIKIVEDMSDLSSDNIEDTLIEMEDTVSLIDSYIDGAEFDLNKDKVKSVMKTLYIEALEVLA